MSMPLTCAHGHQWEGGPDPAEPGSTAVHCPVCGAPAVDRTEAAAGPAPDDSTEQTTVLADPPTVSAAMAPPAPGTPAVLAEYEVLGELGRGGMGVVYKARQVKLKRLVALKMLRRDGEPDPASLARFQREAEASAQLQHPNIVQIYEVGEHDGAPFFSMEYAEGGNLARKLRRDKLPLREAARLAEVLARAVHHAHEHGILHRDLKPSNVLLAADGTPKISDFGLAKRFALSPDSTAEAGPTRTGDVLGTPEYMSPEQAAGRAHELTPAADVYSLGAVLYELLTGKPPFTGTPPVQTVLRVVQEDPVPPAVLRPQVPRDLQTVCLHCLRKEPGRRYPSALALAEDLRAFLAGEPIQARPVGRGERLLLWARRRPVAAALAASGAAAFVGLLVGAFFQSALAVGAVAVAGLLAGAGWYGARLRAALRKLDQQHLRAERNLERLHLLLEATRRLMAATRVEELLLLLAETTASLVNAERATIYLIDRVRHELWSKVALGAGVGEIRVPLGSGIAGTVALGGETINLEDPYADPRFNPEIDRRTGYRTRSLLTLPMRGAGGQILGVFQVLNKRGGPFGPEDVEMLRSLATSAAVAVEKRVAGDGRPAAAPVTPPPCQPTPRTGI
jgi:serine/threonine-protein kinase